MNLFSLQKVNSQELYVSGTPMTQYSVSGSILQFEDNPSEVDLWSAPRRNETIDTMDDGGVNVDFGIDRSKQTAKMKLNVVTQKFYNDINDWYLNDIDQMYLLRSHRNETWVLKWKDLQVNYVATLPDELMDSVPLPTGLPSGTPFKEYADLWELNLEFFVVDYNVRI